MTTGRSKLPFEIGNRVEFDGPSGTSVRCVVVNQHLESGFPERMWALANIATYGTCLVPESVIRKSTWKAPWETAKPTQTDR